MQVDSNGNGSLDSCEVEVLLNNLAADPLGQSRRVTKAEIRNVMEKVDSNKDRRIAFDEFIRVSLCCLTAQQLLDAVSLACCRIESGASA